MARRVDYYNDPAAPKPNSVVSAAVAFVTREDGAVLLIRRADNGDWVLPGGAVEMNESPQKSHKSGFVMMPPRNPHG